MGFLIFTKSLLLFSLSFGHCSCSVCCPILGCFNFETRDRKFFPIFSLAWQVWSSQSWIWCRPSASRLLAVTRCTFFFLLFLIRQHNVVVDELGTTLKSTFLWSTWQVDHIDLSHVRRGKFTSTDPRLEADNTTAVYTVSDFGREAVQLLTRITRKLFMNCK